MDPQRRVVYFVSGDTRVGSWGGAGNVKSGWVGSGAVADVIAKSEAVAAAVADAWPGVVANTKAPLAKRVMETITAMAARKFVRGELKRQSSLIMFVVDFSRLKVLEGICILSSLHTHPTF